MVNVYVRTGRDLLEQSVGLLIDGCEDASTISDISEPTFSMARRRRREADGCDTACSGNTETYDQCVYDCTVITEAPEDLAISMVGSTANSPRMIAYAYPTTLHTLHMTRWF